MKIEKVAYVNGKFPNDVRKIKVSDYKDTLSIGSSVIIEGKKYIVIRKEDSKCVVMDLYGNVKRFYYKYIDYMYLTKETSRDTEIIDFMKTLNLKSLNVVEYEKDSQQFRCEDGQLHSYSFLLNRYLRHKEIA
jgi:hypothetical protein